MKKHRELWRLFRGVTAWVSLSARVGWALAGEAWGGFTWRVRRYVQSSRAGLTPRT